MRAGEATLFHALISTSLNTGLLAPLDACRAAEAAWRAADDWIAELRSRIRPPEPG